MRESLKKPYLRHLLGPKDLEETPVDDVTRHTFGIDISPMQLSGKDLFSVWDFAGQVESFITHQFFLSTESTIFTVVVDMTKPLKDQRAELLWWLGFIKTRNLGQVPFYPSRMEQEAIPMPSRRKEIYRQLQVKPWMVKEGTLLNGSNKEEDLEDGNSSDSQSSMYGSVLQPVPVVVVGSHLDLVPVDQQPEVVGNTQRLVDEMRDRFEEYLEISPKLYPLNCLRAVSAEMKVLKDRLCEVRSRLLEVGQTLVYILHVCHTLFCNTTKVATCSLVPFPDCFHLRTRAIVNFVAWHVFSNEQRRETLIVCGRTRRLRTGKRVKVAGNTYILIRGRILYTPSVECIVG